MEDNKSKPITTSVPSISIKFHANAEQIEELYTSEEDNIKTEDKPDKSPIVSSAPTNIGEPNSSPLKLLNRLGKRSTSVDISSSHPPDASPPSDPWRFFSDIKGKITKSVEEKITEIKARSQEEGSPHHKSKSDLKTVKDSKENSSLSDSEDLSESSISKTCGVISTTEGVEMSSDEDTPSLEKDKLNGKSPRGAQHRFRFFRKTRQEEGTVRVNDLSKLYNINTESADQALPEDSEGVENAVDALEETDNKLDSSATSMSSVEIMKTVAQKIDNLEIDPENVVNVKEVAGGELREEFFNCQEDTVRTVFAPSGFVDLRLQKKRSSTNYTPYLVLSISVVIYCVLHCYCSYIAGITLGVILSYVVFVVYTKLHTKCETSTITEPMNRPVESNKYFEIQAVKEYQPLLKYEGWVNEYPDVYSPETYHIFHTQSVFLRLQGNLLRISHSKNKIPRRAMFNEPEIKASFTRHRIYNLVGAKISLLPEGLARKRLWSKKYPICITLSSEQMNFDPAVLSNMDLEVQRCMDKEKQRSPLEKTSSVSFSKFRRNKDYSILTQRFSKLTEDEEFELDSDSRASTPSNEISDLADFPELNGSTENLKSSPPGDEKSEIKIYLFGRTDREKEDWFRRLCTSNHRSAHIVSSDSDNAKTSKTELDYLKYMSTFKAPSGNAPEGNSLLWLNSLVGRVQFDCVRDADFLAKVRDRIERKLAVIKLPYFIEEIHVPEMAWEASPTFVEKVGVPTVDERGWWVDLDIAYRGVIVLTLQTKLNLMRLKNPQAYEKSSSDSKSAIYNSDVDDSAESSSDEEGDQEIPNVPQDLAASPATGGKKFIKMVDRLAESKIFQAATDNKYIKKAMEGVSNTHLRLTVEVKSIEGTLVLNIPPPPSDRIWLGFRPVPELSLSAKPVVGERNISYIMVTSWIEKKLMQEFQKIMVIPNMEDFVVPVMNPKLPD